MNYFVLYDYNDVPGYYFDDLCAVSRFLGYPLKELLRKFRNSNENFIYLDLDGKRHKLYGFA